MDNQKNTQQETVDTTQTNAAEQNNIASEEVHTTEGSPKKAKLPALILIGALLFAGGYYWYNTQHTDSAMEGETSAKTVRAVVNGEAITQAMIDERMQGAQQALAAQGIDLSNPDTRTQIEAQLLDDAINYVLLTQAAKDTDFDQAKVDELYDGYVTQAGGEDALKAQLAEIGLTPEQFKQRLTDQVRIDAYIAENVDVSGITVSEEEAKELYNSVAPSMGENAPKFEDVRGQIIDQITTQKEQELIKAHIDALRSSADIEMK